MKKLTLISFIALFFSVYLNSVKGQETKPAGYTGRDNVLAKSEQMPEFIGGEKKLFEFISSNLKYPPSAKDKGISGKVYVNFVVDKSGKVRDAKILRGIDPACDAEVLRVVGLMPDWKPGKDGGSPVSVYYNLPVNFALDTPPIKKGK